MNTWPFNLQTIRDFLNNHLSKISADTLGWLAAIVLHCATVPSLLALDDWAERSCAQPGCGGISLGRTGTAVPTCHCAQRHLEHHHHWCGLYSAGLTHGPDPV
jgi:hypothetical protein